MQDDITAINTYATNDRPSKYMKHTEVFTLKRGKQTNYSGTEHHLENLTV